MSNILFRFLKLFKEVFRRFFLETFSVFSFFSVLKGTSKIRVFKYGFHFLFFESSEMDVLGASLMDSEAIGDGRVGRIFDVFRYDLRWTCWAHL